MDIFVTGVGVISAIGTNSGECFDALKRSQTGIRGNYRMQDSNTESYAGAVSLTNESIKTSLGLNLDSVVPRTAMLGMVAAKEAFQGNESRDGIKTGFINGTTTGGMDLTEHYFADVHKRNLKSRYQLVSTHDLGRVTSLISKALNITDYVTTISTACSSSSNSIMLGARMINMGLLDRVLVGGCDALTNFTINGFRSLMIYSDKLCTPFDDNRTGLNLGEGAGYLLLENEKSLTKSNNNVLAKITGWANANDAFHQTGTSPEGTGAFLAMNKALKVSGMEPTAIDYLNAHGTATKNNDDSELAAIERVFTGVDFSSTKGFTGHTLGACGGIEAVFAVMSLANQCAFPNINFSKRMSDHTLEPVTTFFEKKITHVMSNSFGFGGNSTSLIFSAS